MTKKLLVVFLSLAVTVAISLPSFAKDTIAGKVEAVDRDENKITINGNEYLLSKKAAQVKVNIGDMVRATVEGNRVKELFLLQ